MAGVLDPLLENKGFSFTDPDVENVADSSDNDFVYELKSGYDSAEEGDQITVRSSNYDPFDNDNFFKNLNKGQDLVLKPASSMESLTKQKIKK